jgi:hypothetical protein
LGLALYLLEVVPTLPVPEMHCPVIPTSHHHIIVVYRHTINYRVVPRHIPHEVPIRTLPHLRIIRRGRHKRVLLRVNRQPANRLLVVGQRLDGLPHADVPQPDLMVVGAGNHLWLEFLAGDSLNNPLVPTEAVDLGLGSDVPDTDRGVAAARDQEIKGGMLRKTVNPTQMPMISPDDLILLQIPAENLLILPAGEEVRVLLGDKHIADIVRVARQRQLELSACQVPEFDRAVVGTRNEPLIGWIDVYRADPAVMTRNHLHQLPWGMPARFDQLSHLSHS